MDYTGIANSGTDSTALSPEQDQGCLAHNIRLIHIFENEWRDKPELVKSIIRTILKLQGENTIYARKCEVREVSIRAKIISKWKSSTTKR